MKILFTPILFLLSTLILAQEGPVKLNDGYYTLSDVGSGTDSYLLISDGTAQLHWVGRDETFDFTFENLQEVKLDENGFTVYQYAEPEGYDLYPLFVFKPYQEEDEVLHDIEFRVFEKRFKKKIGDTNYYDYGSEKAYGTCCAKLERFDTLEDLLGRY